ncbi:hypothetical protein VN12_14655 [Pirellula sp. SH-Sr6A]|nr:hypothetical protein VN12_14655 [Pirellula sp. SH-Sr6A]
MPSSKRLLPIRTSPATCPGSAKSSRGSKPLTVALNRLHRSLQCSKPKRSMTSKSQTSWLASMICGRRYPALASLPREYPYLHHTHQKLGLLELIQFVLQIVIQLASAVQREKLRGSLGDVGRRPKVQNLFIGWAGTKQMSDLFKDFRSGFPCRHAGPGFESLRTPFRVRGSSQLGSLLSGSAFRVDITTFCYTGPGHMNRAHPNGEFPARFIWPQSPVSAPLLTLRSGSLGSGSVGR